MWFSSAKLLTLALAFISATAAVPVENKELEKRGERVILGYLTGAYKDIKRFRNERTLVYSSVFDEKQAGRGVYLTQSKHNILIGGIPDPWYCVVRADAAAVKRVSKAWVPQTYGRRRSRVTLWHNNKNIDKYIKDLEDSWRPEKTIRLTIDAYSNFSWLVIPEQLLNKNGGAMGITIFCSNGIGQLPNKVVNPDHFKDNIKGNRT